MHDNNPFARTTRVVRALALVMAVCLIIMLIAWWANDKSKTQDAPEPFIIKSVVSKKSTNEYTNCTLNEGGVEVQYDTLWVPSDCNGGNFYISVVSYDTCQWTVRHIYGQWREKAGKTQQSIRDQLISYMTDKFCPGYERDYCWQACEPVGKIP